jgi:hypothetical protein
MARLYKAARRGEIATGDASRLGFILMGLAKLIEGGDLEKRLEALEENLHANTTEEQSHKN